MSICGRKGSEKLLYKNNGLLTHYQATNFRLFQNERVCRGQFHIQYDENARNLSKRVENTVGKGEIARYEQFVLFPQCFQKSSFPGASKGVIVWEWVKAVDCLTLYQTTNFRLVQIENICRRQNERNSKFKICLGKRRHCGKRRKCWLPAFSPNVFKRLLSQGH